MCTLLSIICMLTLGAELSGRVGISYINKMYTRFASPLRLSPFLVCLLVSCWAACTIVKLMHGKGCLASKAAAHFSVLAGQRLKRAAMPRLPVCCKIRGLSCKDKATSCLSCRLVGFSTPTRLTALRCTQMGRGQAMLFVLRRGLWRDLSAKVLRLDDCVLFVSRALAGCGLQ